MQQSIFVSTPSTELATQGIGHVTLALLVVLAVIFSLAWLVRRARGVTLNSNNTLSVLASVSVGQRERAVLIRCGETQLLLGVAQGQVTRLHTLGPSTTPVSQEKIAPIERPDFKTLLLRSLGK
jgi:flagellar protein FliO/FliZ